jgi:hypothetical protein
MAILPRDANEKVRIVRFEFAGGQIIIERFLCLEPFLALLAFFNQGIGILLRSRCDSDQAKGRKN